jgi:hypothetical protein
MNLLNILKFAGPLVMQAIALAEKDFSETPKSGAQKKAAVVDVAKTIITDLENFSTGGMHNTWTILSTPISNLIDAGAALLFGK